MRFSHVLSLLSIAFFSGINSACNLPVIRNISSESNTTETKQSPAAMGRVYLGENIAAAPRQDLTVIAYFDMKRESIESIHMTTTWNSDDIVEGDFEPSQLADYSLQKSFEMRIPEFEIIPIKPQEIAIEVFNKAGQVVSDAILVVIRDPRRMGDEALYSWDLRMFAEYDQPRNAIPELSIFSVDATSTLLRGLFPNTNELDIPFPLMLQPQTSRVVGRNRIPVSCNRLLPGQGYCVAFEDWLREGRTDGDYDMLFHSRPESTKLTLWVEPISSMGAKNRADLILKTNPAIFSNVRIKTARAGIALSDTTMTLTKKESRITLWQDQKTVFQGQFVPIQIEFQLLQNSNL